MTYRLRNILVAVVLAVMAAFLTALYVANYQNRVDDGQTLVKVFVAKSDIPPGTQLDALDDFVAQREIQKKSVAPAAVYELDSLKGQTTSQWIYRGEQVSARRFNATGRTGIHAELKGNFRAISIPGNKQQLLAGVLKTGDRVDVIAHFGVASRVLLRDLRVLRAPQTQGIDSNVANQDNGFDVVLQVTDSQAHKLFFVTSGVVDNDFDWWLDLRAPAEATDSPESITTFPSAIRDGLPANQLGRADSLNREEDR